MIITGNNGTHQLYKNETDVKAIWIHDTNSKFIPENLGISFNLIVLIMSNTHLIEIKANGFKRMEDLEQISNNNLSFLPVDAFTKLTKLKLLYLNSNQIEALSNGLFTNNNELKLISLVGNQIQFLGSTLFDGLTKLNRVDLKRNNR